MFESSRQRGSEITLCLFPHLKEFLAVDTRKLLPDGPSVRIISFNDIYTEEFIKNVESGFGALMRRKDAGLMDMIGIPQEVETLVRGESLKRVIKQLDHAAGLQTSENVEGIGVLFFTRGLLSIAPDQLEVAMRELFGSTLTREQVARLISELQRLIGEEKKAEDGAMKTEVSRLITGQGGPFLTLWENERGK